MWRPRPPSLLTRDQQRQVRKNLKQYSRAFDEEDALEESNVSIELLAHRRRLIDEWNAWRARCKEELAEDASRRGSRAGKEPVPEESREEIVEWIDEVLEQTEEIVE